MWLPSEAALGLPNAWRASSTSGSHAWYWSTEVGTVAGPRQSQDGRLL